MNEFINVLSLVDAPRLKFEEDYITIGDSTGRSKVKYFYSAEETLTTSQKDITMPDTDVKFVLTNSVLNKLNLFSKFVNLSSNLYCRLYLKIKHVYYNFQSKF